MQIPWHFPQRTRASVDFLIRRGLGNNALWILSVCARVRAQLLQSCLTLRGTRDHSPPGSSVHGILQERRLDWVAMPSSKGSSWPRNRTCVSGTEHTSLSSRFLKSCFPTYFYSFSCSMADGFFTFLFLFSHTIIPQESSLFSIFCRCVDISTCGKRTPSYDSPFV